MRGFSISIDFLILLEEWRRDWMVMEINKMITMMRSRVEAPTLKSLRTVVIIF